MANTKKSTSKKGTATKKASSSKKGKADTKAKASTAKGKKKKSDYVSASTGKKVPFTEQHYNAIMLSYLLGGAFDNSK